jgi:acetamidase/formamidase
MSHSRTIHQSHLGWDNSLEPAARIAPGEILQFDVLDAAGGQLSESIRYADRSSSRARDPAMCSR